MKKKLTKRHYFVSGIFVLGVFVAFLLAWLGGALPTRLNLAQLTLPQEEQNWQFPIYNWGLNYRDNYGVYSQRFNNYHAGEDWFLPAGTRVYATADGVVRRVANFDADKDYGGFVAIEHTLSDNSKVVSIYGHLDWRRIKVSTGQTVTRGTHLGYLGSSAYNGNWTPHLHFGLRQGAYVSNSFVYKGYYSQTELEQHWLKPRDFILPRLFDQTDPEITINKPVANAFVDNFIDIDVTVTDPSGLGRTRVWVSTDNGQSWSILHQTSKNVNRYMRTWDVTTKDDDTFKLIVDACDRFTNCSNAPAQVTFTKDIIDYLVENRPAGTLLNSGGAAIYLLDAERNIRVFPSYPIYKTHKRNRQVRRASQAEIDTYHREAAVGFADGNLIRVVGTQTVYLITDSGSKRPFATATAFKRQGLSFSEVKVVSAKNAAYHSYTSAIRDTSPLADGLFVKGSGPTVYYITGGKRRAISHAAILKSWASFAAIHRVADTLIQTMPRGELLPFAEGSLVRPKNDPTVYIISNEQKVAVASPRALKNFGYSFAEVRVVPSESLQDLEIRDPGLKLPSKITE